MHWKQPRQLEGEDAQFMCQGPCLTPIPAPRVQQPWKNFVASLATDKEAAPPMRKLISADLHDIKIIKKEGRLKGKWL